VLFALGLARTRGIRAEKLTDLIYNPNFVQTAMRMLRKTLPETGIRSYTGRGLSSNDGKEAVRAIFEKRSPLFTGT